MIKKVLKLFFVFILSLSFTGCMDNDALVTNDASNNSKDNISVDTQFEKQNTSVDSNDYIDEEHALYIEFMKNADYANPKRDSGDFVLPYTFYDINQDGRDELIIKGGHINYQIYTCIKDEVICIGTNKYGADKHMFYWSGGHMDSYFEEFFEVTSAGVEEYASKHWENNPSTGKTKNATYKIKNKKVKKTTYNNKTNKIKSEYKLSDNDLNWLNVS